MASNSRLVKLRKKMKQSGLSGLLLTSPIARRYITGLHTSAGVVLITNELAFFATDFRYIQEAESAAADFEVSMITRDRGAYEQIKEKIADCGIKTLGFEADTMTVAEFEKWESVTNVDMCPAQSLIVELRMVKDSTEVQYMTEAQRIAEKALEEVVNFVLVPGVTERYIACELICRMLKNGAQGISFQPIVVSGPNSSLPHGRPGERIIEKGDFVTMDFGCMINGYCSDMTRTVAIGYVTDKMRRVYDTVLCSQEAGIAKARAMVSGKDIDSAARSVIDKAGYGDYFGHGFGHGLGLEVHEAPNANAANDTPMPLGAVISAEPGIYLPGEFGVRIEDVVQLESRGCLNFTLAPKELLIID